MIEDKIDIESLGLEAPNLVKYLKECHDNLWVKFDGGKPVRPVMVITSYHDPLISYWDVFSGEKHIGRYTYAAEPIDGGVLWKQYTTDGKVLEWNPKEGRQDRHTEIPFP